MRSFVSRVPATLWVRLRVVVTAAGAATAATASTTPPTGGGGGGESGRGGGSVVPPSSNVTDLLDLQRQVKERKERKSRGRRGRKGRRMKKDAGAWQCISIHICPSYTTRDITLIGYIVYIIMVIHDSYDNTHWIQQRTRTCTDLYDDRY